MTQEEALSAMKMGYNVFLTGPPGSGKTFLLNRYILYLKKKDIAVSITASTGIAATHMGGTTLHSWSGLGIREEVGDDEVKYIADKGYLRKRIKNTNVLIIDEISMIKASQFEAVNKICQYVRRNPRPFGGIQVICSGDFFQLPPVEREGREVKFVVESNIWKKMDMKICYLLEQYRTKDKKLHKLLDHIRDNEIDKSKAILFAAQKKAKPLQDVPTKLYTHNVDVDSINNSELAKISGKEYTYQMTGRGHEVVVAALKKSCLAPEMLVLKKDAQVMFIKNNFEAGYVNGTQGKIVGFVGDGLPIVKTRDGKRITVKTADWTIEEENSVVAGISQIPLRLAWAITVHKSQGMNLDSAEIDLSRCFLEGMGYVALSRIRSLEGLKLVGINNLAFCVNPRALELDKDFRKSSKKSLIELNKMSAAAIGKRQKLWVKYLSN
ncbi:MAG: PIF1 family DEAD/DEAH box helicase [Candidatus Staskawiczbacteria bacterium]|jgi:ATP-dependent exoDNAse (exonuclease V) alpha subunit